MALPVVYRRKVGRDLAGGFGYYEGQTEGLGEQFLAAVDSAFDAIEHYPEMFARVHGEVRHALMGNRNRLCLDIEVRSALETETEVAKDMLSRQARKRVRPTTLGADKGYHTKDFVAHLRNKNIAPHAAQIEGRNTPGPDARTMPVMRSAGERGNASRRSSAG